MIEANRIKLNLTAKQSLAYDFWNDKVTEEILIGGGAGGGKTFLGCFFLIHDCFKYEGSRWFIGRDELKRLKQTTLETFFKKSSEWGISSMYHIDWGKSVIRFINGSSIFMLDLSFMPQDPEYERLGSFEFTGGFIDEAGEIKSKCKDILRARCRYMLDETKGVPKILMSCNPTKNFLYGEFYKPSKENKLEHYKAFVQMLAKDNRYLPESYIRTLERIQDKATKERLLFGNWEYDDDPSALMTYDSIVDIFTNVVDKEEDLKYITADVARYGSDKTIICVWKGLQIKKIITMEKKSTVEVATKIKGIAIGEGVPNSRIAIDEDGIGGGVVDQLSECKGFIGGSHAIEQAYGKQNNYLNLRSQCYMKLGELVNEAKIGIDSECISVSDREFIVEELQQIKQRNKDSDGKLCVTKKDEIKEHIGRSPDHSDTIMMRMIFEVQPKINFAFASW